MRKFEYKVFLKNRIDILDDKVLTYLYQPIIGLKSLAIYKLLINEAEVIKQLQKQEFYNEDRLIKLSMLSSDQLSWAIKKLEAMGLVVTLQSKINEAKIFNIYPPLEPKQFFEYSLFNSALLEKIGKKNYEIAQLMFKEDNCANESDYKNTSSKFLEVFEEFNKNLKEEVYSKIQTRPKKTNVLLEGLDFESIFKNLQNKNICVSKENEKLKNVIEEVYLSYNLTEETIIDALIKAYDEQEVDLDIEKFYIIISSKYLVHEDTASLDFDPELNKKTKTNAKIKEMETIDPIHFLELLMNVDCLDLVFLELIRSLRREYKLRDGVINCLLEYSYLKNESKIVKNYILKIAKTFNERDISNAKEAMDYLKLANKKSKVSKKDLGKYIKENNVLDNRDEEYNEDSGYTMEFDENIKPDPNLWGNY
ncbi:chromosome replication initiation and membrane attachment protein [Spiroplasma gladiatoris]|uniref:Chromosome replication initiation and membrane attachment protein n=1 Tax=Spiroplasma gladiatoris TaxID=2143 RepID=A0A4P7AIF2_9MOLU|nr:DnaD domain protein [Spiroplasma gladiatoris]QBQ08042.1 chromosome replication initiation and membrane attachment protein [Spiroplasma gladiatoris]